MTTKKRIYISGKITGLDLDVARGYFKQTEMLLNAAGMLALNPMDLVPFNEKYQWHDYMAEDVRILLICDAIFMLENWQDSKGAKIEHAIAKEHGIDIYYEKTHKFF